MSEPFAASSPRAWFDENDVPCFRADVAPEEASELQSLLVDAYNRGLISAYKQQSSSEYVPGLVNEGERVDVTYFRHPKRVAVKTSLWRTLWYVLKGNRVYVS